MSKTTQQRANGQIRATRVRLIDQDGNQKGEMHIKDARALADEAGLDVVEVAPNANPPVVRIMDFGRERYRQEKKEKASRKGQKSQGAHQLRMTPVIAEHDLATKRRAAERFLKKGDQVRLTVQMRGRQKAHPELARNLIDRLVEELSELGSPLRPVSQDANAVQVILSPLEH